MPDVAKGASDAIIGFVPISNQFSLQRTISFLPFFMVGYYSKEYGWLEKIRKISTSVTIMILVITLSLFFFCNSADLLTMTRLYENTPYSHGLYDCVARLCIWLMAVGNSIVFIKLVSPNNKVALLGGLTLYIYVYHQFIIEILMRIVMKFNIPQVIPIIIVEAIIVIFLCCIMTKFSLFKSLVNPITSLIKRV